MKRYTLCWLLLFSLIHGSHAQYLAVKARYTETRLIDDAPNPPKRENRLLLTFYDVSPAGVYTPANLVNQDLYIYKEGLQFGGYGGVMDSIGNNYPGYAYTAPRAVAYYNSLGPQYIDCDTYRATRYTVNGHVLDCGFVGVSYWDIDYGTGEPLERFTAPNICLPYYEVFHPFFTAPGNLNFYWPFGIPGPPYDLYNFDCGGPLQLIIRGLLAADSSSLSTLPVRFSGVGAELEDTGTALIYWANEQETDIDHYAVEKSVTGNNWETGGLALALINNGSRVDYRLWLAQPERKVFYRIRARENSGQEYFSPVFALQKPAAVQTSRSQELMIYPNPVQAAGSVIKLPQADPGRYILSILSADGRPVRRSEILHSGGDLLQPLSPHGLLPGPYLLELRHPNKKFQQSFLYVN